MSELQKQIDDAKEFINGSQEVIAKLNEALLVLNQLMEKQEAKNRGAKISSRAREAFEEELRLLLKRHLHLDQSMENLLLPSNATLQDAQKSSHPRPGKYRSLV